MNINTLRLHRFNGIEEFLLGECNVRMIDGDTYDHLNIDFFTQSPAVHVLEDTAENPTKPCGEIDIIAKRIIVKNIPGKTFEIKESFNEQYGDNVTRFYYYEHVEIRDVVIKFIQRDGEKILIEITGYIQDVNYYDGSKPDTKIELLGWFICDKSCGLTSR
jgi:hypothetical protein